MLYPLSYGRKYLHFNNWRGASAMPHDSTRKRRPRKGMDLDKNVRLRRRAIQVRRAHWRGIADR
jgi:hypothetical protein